MNMDAPSFFTPPAPPVSEGDPGLFAFFAAVRSNRLQIWPRRAYEEDVLVNSGFGRKRFLLNSPKAIHRVLVENPSNYARTPATIRILRPITGDGLLLSEGAASAQNHRAGASAAGHADAGSAHRRRGAGDDRPARCNRR
jgi:unspecific monooxygenase